MQCLANSLYCRGRSSESWPKHNQDLWYDVPETNALKTLLQLSALEEPPWTGLKRGHEDRVVGSSRNRDRYDDTHHETSHTLEAGPDQARANPFSQ